MLYFYDLLKLLHFISAAMLLTSFSYCGWLWLKSSATAINRITTQTWAIVVPFALFQLASGFTLISLKRADLPQCWIMECTLSFMLAMASWFTFVYLLLFTAPTTVLKKLQTFLLALCTISLCVMIFLMANKPVGAL